MSQHLTAEALQKHVRAIARDIGPRPTGHTSEELAQAYVRDALQDAGLHEIEEIPFPTWDTWGYATISAQLLALTGNLWGKLGRGGKAVGGLLSLTAAYQAWQAADCGCQPLAPLYPFKRETKNLLVRIPAVGERRHKVVLVGHTDTNKHRSTFAPARKRFLQGLETVSMMLPLLNGAVQLAQAAGKKLTALHKLSVGSLLMALAMLLFDEKEGYVEGANDNATAVAALLGLGAHLQENRLQHTEVWLAFTSAEEVGCVGLHKLLDEHGHQLADAYFIDFEMVGCRDVAYVTHHGSFSYLTGYEPDALSLRLAEETALHHPDLGVNGRGMVMSEEVGALRSRNYKGICLVGVGDDGWLTNWHQYSDNFANIEPEGIERAARFALAMMERLDQQN